jgi:hypothetical protein
MDTEIEGNVFLFAVPMNTPYEVARTALAQFEETISNIESDAQKRRDEIAAQEVTAQNAAETLADLAEELQKE